MSTVRRKPLVISVNNTKSEFHYIVDPRGAFVSIEGRVRAPLYP
jgi:hypothetical protein